MVAPASNQVAADFAITSEPVLVITVTVFLLAQGGSRLLVNHSGTIDDDPPSSGPIGFGSAV